MVNQLFTDGYGRLTLDRYAFQHHVDGTQFRHKAPQIDLNPTLTINTILVTNVQDALSATKDELATLELSGKGFITVGDGYDTYHFSNPEDPGYNANAPFDSATPAFNTYLNNLLNISDPLDPDYNPLHARIRSGGIILIKAGTYIFLDTVDIPPGMTIMGEGYGTKIVNASSLNLGTSPPDLDTGGTPKSLFNIKIDLNRSANDAAIDVSLFIFSRETVIRDLIIADNFVEPTLLGDLNYQKPQNREGFDTPLISQEAGSNFILDNVMVLGRATFSSGKAINDVTSFAVKLDESLPVTTGTYLTVTNCFIDGFAQPVSFDSVGGRNDYLDINNCRIRSHGYLLADGVNQENNCVIHMNDNNAIISNNDFYGNHDDLTTLCFVKAVIAAPPAAGDLAQILISSNEMIVSKGGSAIGADPIIVDAGIAATFNQYAYILAYGTLSANGFAVGTTADASTQIYADASNIVIGTSTNITLQSTAASISLSGGTIANAAAHIEERIIVLDQSTCPGGTYTIDVDGGQKDYIMLFPNNSNFVTIGQVAVTMPPVTVGRILIFKEIQNDSSGGNTLTCAGTDLIEDIGGTGYIASTSFAAAGLTVTYIGVFDAQTALNRWSILSAWSVNVLL